MPAYKVTYFNVKGLAEPMRYLLAYGNIDYEDVRVERENWPALKSNMPMGQIPVLEVDGKKAHQSVSICRYLGKQVGLGGANDWENLEIDSVVDTMTDFRLKITAVHQETDPDLQAKKREVLEKEHFPFYLEKLEAIATENNGHLAVGKLTWADIYFASLFELLNVLAKRNMTDGFPHLKKLIDTVQSIDSIKKWIAKRPVTEM